MVTELLGLLQGWTLHLPRREHVAASVGILQTAFPCFIAGALSNISKAEGRQGTTCISQVFGSWVQLRKTSIMDQGLSDNQFVKSL